jgi:hypothetical protein
MTRNNYNLNNIIQDWQAAYRLNESSAFLRKEQMVHYINRHSLKVNYEIKPNSEGFRRIEEVTKRFLAESDQLVSSVPYTWNPANLRQLPSIPNLEGCLVLKVSPQANFGRFKPEPFDRASHAMLEALDSPFDMSNIHHLMYNNNMTTLVIMISSTYALIKIIPIVKSKFIFMTNNLMDNPTEIQINYIKSRPGIYRILNQYILEGKDISMLCSDSDPTTRFMFKRLMHESIFNTPSSGLNEVKLMNVHANSLADAVKKSHMSSDWAFVDFPPNFISNYKQLINELFGVKNIMTNLLNKPTCVKELADVDILPFYQEELQRLNDIAHVNAIAYIDLITHAAISTLG